MAVFSKRNLVVGIAIFAIGVGVSAALWKMPRFMRRSTSIKSQVTAYLLDDRGEVNGLLLASGDQLPFSPQTGAVVASQIKVGDDVTASGHAGSNSRYGREVRITHISANGRTIVEAEAGPPRPHKLHDTRGPRDREDRADRPGPPDARARGGAQPTPALPSPPSPELFKAVGTIRTHLVNGHGAVDGLILSSGEQVRFSRRVGELVVAAEQSATTQVSVEGNGVRNARGTIIRPTQITVGTQTIAPGR